VITVYTNEREGDSPFFHPLLFCYGLALLLHPTFWDIDVMIHSAILVQ
jgi:hypothetical protein